MDEVCDYYYPIFAEGEDDMITAMIEQGRGEYREAWYDYIKEFE